MTTKFQERVKGLIDVDAPNLWSTLKFVERKKVEKTMGIHGRRMKM